MENVPMHSRRSRSLLGLAHMRWPLIALLLVGYGCSPAPKPSTGSGREALENGRVTFVQWSDPHVFDAGAARKDNALDPKGIEEEQLDNWSALHWAVLQTNRLVRDNHRSVDFVVITGDFGLYNVVLPQAGNYRQEACRRDAKEGPVASISMDEDAQLVARELSALSVKSVYLVPGNNDLCDENPANLYRWAEFVRKLQQNLQAQRQARPASLDCAKKMKVTVPDGPPEPPQVVDLTFTAERLLNAKDDNRLKALNTVPATPPASSPCQLEILLQPATGAPSQATTASKETVGSSAGKATEKNATTKVAAGKKAGKKSAEIAPAVQNSAPPVAPVAPVEHGFTLLGLDSAYFKPSETPELQK